jgi:hypothetical protein
MTSEKPTRRAGIGFDPGAVQRIRPRQAMVRFAAGAGASLAAALISLWAGSEVSGPFLALPAILMASLTLIADEEGVATAIEDAWGAVCGGVGLVAFAVVAALLLGSLPTWLVLLLATLVWAVISIAVYRGQRILLSRCKRS